MRQADLYKRRLAKRIFRIAKIAVLIGPDVEKYFGPPTTPYVEREEMGGWYSSSQLLENLEKMKHAAQNPV